MSSHELKLELKKQIEQLPLEMLLKTQEFLNQISKIERGKNKRKIGALKGGLIYMAPDFDEPLEDFKDYM